MTKDTQLSLALAGLTNEPIKVGDYVIMEEAGGHSYHPDNNGCLAVVTELKKWFDMEDAIAGEILNPRYGEPIWEGYNHFECVPIKNDDRVIVRKASKGELIAYFGITVSPANLTHYKIGDSVRITGKTRSVHHFEIGSTAVIKETTPRNNCMWLVQGKLGQYVNPKDFILASMNLAENNLTTTNYMTKVLKRSDYIKLLKIVPVSCEWYKRLKDHFADFAIKDEIEIHEDFYKEGRAAANTTQTELLDRIFGKDVEEVDHKVLLRRLCVRGAGQFADKSIYLPYGYDYKITIDTEGIPCLIATLK